MNRAQAEEAKRRAKAKTPAPPPVNGAAPTRRIWTSAELLAEPFPDPRFVVPGVLPEGLMVLAGRPKLGKSWLLLDWAHAVSSSALAMGKIACEQGEALILALEDSPRRLKGRLRKLGAAGSGCLEVTTQWPRTDEGGLQDLRDYLGKHQRCRLVGIDTLGVQGEERPLPPGAGLHARDAVSRSGRGRATRRAARSAQRRHDVSAGVPDLRQRADRSGIDGALDGSRVCRYRFARCWPACPERRCMKRPAPRFTVEHRQLAPRKRKAKPPRPKRAAIRQALDLARPLEGAPRLAAPSCLTTTTKRDAAE